MFEGRKELCSLEEDWGTTCVSGAFQKKWPDVIMAENPLGQGGRDGSREKTDRSWMLGRDEGHAIETLRAQSRRKCSLSGSYK